MIEYPKEFINKIKTLPTRFHLTQEINRELEMRIKVWKGRKQPDGKVYFTDRNRQESYNRLEYAKNIFTKITEDNFKQLQFKQYQKELLEGEQKQLF